MSKPSELPEWASSVSADITEPMLAKKQQGWIVEQPAHDVFNWWMNLVFLWAAWLQAFESTIHTWTATQTFAAISSSAATLTAGTVAGAPSAGTDITNKTYVDGKFSAPTAQLLGGLSGASQAVVTGSLKPSLTKDAFGNVVFVGNMGRSGGDSTSSISLASGSIPSGYRPAGTTQAPVMIQNAAGSTTALGYMVVFADGSITIFGLGTSWKFTSWSIAYNVNQPVA